MTALSNSNEHRVAGSIHFDPSVTPKQLLVVLAGLKSLGEMNRWVDLHIRPDGDDGSHVIAFHYILLDGRKKTQDKLVDRVILFLKDYLGTQRRKKAVLPKGVRSWTISTVQTLG